MSNSAKLKLIDAKHLKEGDIFFDFEEVGRCINLDESSSDARIGFVIKCESYSLAEKVREDYESKIVSPCQGLSLLTKDLDTMPEAVSRTIRTWQATKVLFHIEVDKAEHIEMQLMPLNTALLYMDSNRKILDSCGIVDSSLNMEAIKSVVSRIAALSNSLIDVFDWKKKPDTEMVDYLAASLVVFNGSTNSLINLGEVI